MEERLACADGRQLFFFPGGFLLTLDWAERWTGRRGGSIPVSVQRDGAPQAPAGPLSSGGLPYRYAVGRGPKSPKLHSYNTMTAKVDRCTFRLSSSTSRLRFRACGADTTHDKRIRRLGPKYPPACLKNNLLLHTCNTTCIGRYLITEYAIKTLSSRSNCH